MPAQTPPVTPDARQPDDRVAESARPPPPGGARSGRSADAAADQHDGTDTWKQAADTTERLRATREESRRKGRS